MIIVLFDMLLCKYGAPTGFLNKISMLNNLSYVLGNSWSTIVYFFVTLCFVDAYVFILQGKLNHKRIILP